VAACGANGVTATGCTANDGTPDILEFSGNATGIANTPEIDATGFTDLQVHFTAAYAAAATYDADENIEVNACCGSGCTPLLNIDTADSADNGGSDDWTERGPIVLPNGIFSECATTHVSFVQSTDAAGEVAHMDDFAISGAGSIGLSLTDNFDTTYTGDFSACAADIVPVTCTWGTAKGTFIGNSTTVTFN
jgi:hypothetical protein